MIFPAANLICSARALAALIFSSSSSLLGSLFCFSCSNLCSSVILAVPYIFFLKTVFSLPIIDFCFPVLLLTLEFCLESNFLLESDPATAAEFTSRVEFIFLFTPYFILSINESVGLVVGVRISCVTGFIIYFRGVRSS